MEKIMSRILRYVLIGAISLIVLLAALAGVTLVVLDPNDYKPQIEAAAFGVTGKKLRLQGELSLSLFPRVSIQAGPAFMEDDASFGPEPFLTVEKVNAAVALMPLFNGKADIGDVAVSGARLKLAVDKNGANNWSMPEKTRKSAATHTDGPQTTGKSPLASVALDSIVITDATIVYLDMPAKTDVTVTVKKLTLHNVKVGEKSTLALDARLAGLFAKPADISLAASFTLHTSLAEGTRVTAEGKFADVPFSFQGYAALPNSVALKGNASFGAINLDTFAVPAKKSTPGGGKAAGTRTASTPDEKKLAETLRDLFLDVHVKVQSVTANNIPLKNIEATVKADQGMITAKPVSLDIFGPVTAEASLDARGSAIKSRLSGDWKNVTVGPLVKALSGKTPLTGTLNVSWHVNATGLAWPSASGTLNGKASVNLLNGNIPAFQLIPKGIPGLAAMTLDLANVSSSSTWNITNGVAVNNDLTMKAMALSGTGEGSVNIPADRIDYKMNVNIPTIKELPNLKILPLVISGPISSPSYGVDQPTVLRQTVKSVLDPSTKVGKEVEKGLGKTLNKLF